MEPVTARCTEGARLLQLDTGELRAACGGASILVLGGGPDAEREVSINSSTGVAAALRDAGFAVRHEIINRLTPAELRGLGGDVIFPVLHGPWGEGGPLQDILAADGRPFVGCQAAAARHAIDKIATKLIAAHASVRTAPAGILAPRDSECPMPLPAVLKPVHEGSSVGVHLCRTRAQWDAARAEAMSDMAAHPGRVYMVEPLIDGEEMTVGVLDPSGPESTSLPVIRIKAAVEFYDYEAKYTRDDTTYDVKPPLRDGLDLEMQSEARQLARAMGVRHLCRVDFLVDRKSVPWLLEVNTMPGFTSHSLVPMAAAATGLTMPRLCAALCAMAVRDRQPMV